MTAMRAKDRCGSFLRPGRTAERSGNRRNRSISAYSGHFDVKELGIKDCVLIDPCCGSGGMFVQSAKFVENHSGNINNIAIYGEDSNPTTWKMAQMNLAMLTASLFFM